MCTVETLAFFSLCPLFLSLYCLFLGAEVGGWSNLNLSCAIGFLNSFSKAYWWSTTCISYGYFSPYHELTSDFLKQGTKGLLTLYFAFWFLCFCNNSDFKSSLDLKCNLVLKLFAFYLFTFSQFITLHFKTEKKQFVWRNIALDIYIFGSIESLLSMESVFDLLDIFSCTEFVLAFFF